MQDAMRGEALRTDRIVDLVYARLRDLIVGHELGPGAHLSVPALADRSQVSRSQVRRSPAREAVFQAVRDGLAEERPRRGASVASFARADPLPFLELPEALEGMAARLAAERRTPDDLAAMTTCLDGQAAMIEADDIASFVEADIALHGMIVAASRSAALVEAAENLLMRLRIALAMRATPTGPGSALEWHRTIVDAIAARDGDAAEAAARQHIRNAIARSRDASAAAKPGDRHVW